MQVINASGIEDALTKGVLLMNSTGRSRNSRNGPVLEVPTPVTTVYKNPTRKILFRPERDGNVFFHLFETLWFLGGRDDLQSLLLFNSGMARYSDDGRYVRGSAYGARWRKWFQHDQLENAIKALSDDSDTRRVVLSQWDPYTDAVITSKDVPCNTQCFLYRRADGALDMTVVNRSNDIIYGCYGSNVVHFAMTLEYLASAIGCEVGYYYQVSNSYHAYTDNEVWQRVSATITADGYGGLEDYDYYEQGKARSMPMFGSPAERELFDKDNALFLDWVRYNAHSDLTNAYDAFLEPIDFHTEFFQNVVQPMMSAWFAWKSRKSASMARKLLDRHTTDLMARDVDWVVAGVEWLERRKSQ